MPEIDGTETTGPLLRVGVYDAASEAEAVEAATAHVGATEAPHDVTPGTEGHYVVSFERAYL